MQERRKATRGGLNRLWMSILSSLYTVWTSWVMVLIVSGVRKLSIPMAEKMEALLRKLSSRPRRASSQRSSRQKKSPNFQIGTQAVIPALAGKCFRISTPENYVSQSWSLERAGESVLPV